jgi:hypothetical protein
MGVKKIVLDGVISQAGATLRRQGHSGRTYCIPVPKGAAAAAPFNFNETVR